ncbi:ABC transporter ATP-binding protein [Candidatus Woesearchaeota archaeon]|nr:ABC transporter ATP-binding protein [Candidatus Woesearchaeota archaeon]
MTKTLEISNISKSFLSNYRRKNVLNKVSFSVNYGEIVAILGPNGCGKTTLLNIIAGILKPDDGSVIFNNEEIIHPSWQRTMIFQELNLFPWKTSLENIVFGLRAKGLPKKEAIFLAKSQLKLLGIENFSNYYPNQLSVGTKQKVAIARALALEPDILLLDEPFSSLDMQSRELFQEDLINIAKQRKQTMLIVTHSIDEALFMSDRIIILNGSPAKVNAVINLAASPNRTPRYRNTQQFSKLKNEIWEILRSKD